MNFIPALCLVGISSLFLSNCSSPVKAKNTTLNDENIRISNDLNYSQGSLKTYKSQEIQCGSSVFQFQSKCYDELEGLADRGSYGGSRNYCQNIQLKIKGENLDKTLKYPILPRYRLDQYLKLTTLNRFDENTSDSRLVPETVACAVSGQGKYYVFLDHPYAHNTHKLTGIDLINTKSIILDTKGHFVSEALADKLNEEHDPAKLKFLESYSSNLLLLNN